MAGAHTIKTDSHGQTKAQGRATGAQEHAKHVAPAASSDAIRAYLGIKKADTQEVKRLLAETGIFHGG